MRFDIQKIRENFPIFKKSINGKPIIYMDSACVSLKPTCVINAINKYYNEFPACGGRSEHRLGKKVSEEVQNSRKIIQKFLNAKKINEIIFTKNSTEGINLFHDRSAALLLITKSNQLLLSPRLFSKASSTDFSISTITVSAEIIIVSTKVITKTDKILFISGSL